MEVGVQTYGGGLWHTWFDRDLTIAGRIIIRKGKEASTTYSHQLVRIEEPIMRIPTLAIHLDRGVNDGFKVNNQTHLAPVLATSVKAELNKEAAENGKIENAVPAEKRRPRRRIILFFCRSLLQSLTVSQMIYVILSYKHVILNQVL